MRGKISRGKQPRFAPVFRLFSALAPSARKKYAALRFSLRLPLRRPPHPTRQRRPAPQAKKRSRLFFFSLLYILSTDTHRARFLHSVTCLARSLGRNDSKRPIRLRGFGYAFAAPLRVTEAGVRVASFLSS